MSDFGPNDIAMHAGMTGPQNGYGGDNSSCVEQLQMCSVSNGQQPEMLIFQPERWLIA
jgi:hypothetical protein